MQIIKNKPAGITGLLVILAVAVCLTIFLTGCGKDNTQQDSMLKEVNESLREQLASKEEQIKSLEEKINSMNFDGKTESGADSDAAGNGTVNPAGKTESGANSDAAGNGTVNPAEKTESGANSDAEENGTTNPEDITDESLNTELEKLKAENEALRQQLEALSGDGERKDIMNEYALVNVPVITLYETASVSSEYVDEALYGMKVQILSDEGEFVKVITHYRYEGYVKKEELLFSQELIDAWENNEHAIILSSTADILTIPAFKGNRIINLPRAAQVIVTGETTDSGWTKVVLADGKAGYVRSSFLGECLDSMYVDIYDQNTKASEFLMETYGISEEEFRTNVTELALTYLGTQYRWGGKSTLGIDCSGICSICYMMSGICIYRDAKIVEGFAVHAIDRKDIKKGDLLFFKGHVAMYLGDGKYVHSTGKVGSDGVVINSLNPGDPDYREDLDKGMLACGSIF